MPKTKLGIYHQYTDEDKATALALLEANGGNVKGTARELGIPEPTLRFWKNGQGINRAVVENYDVKKGDLGDLFELVVRKYIGKALDEETIIECSGRDAVMTAAIATDKMRLLRDQATSIAGKAELNDDELEARLQQLAQRIRERQSKRLDQRGEGGASLPAPEEGPQGPTPAP